MELDTTAALGLIGGGVALVSPAVAWLAKQNVRLQKQLEILNEARTGDLKENTNKALETANAVHEAVSALQTIHGTTPPR